MNSLLILRRALRLAVALTAIYYVLIGLTSIDIYKNRLSNNWTDLVERVFPFPAAVVDHEVIPLSRFRKEVKARETVATKNKLGTSDKEIESTVMDRLVNSVLYAHAIKKQSITITSSDIDQALNNVYQQIGGKENLAKFLQDDYGAAMSISDFRTLIQEFLVQSAIEKQVLVHASVRHILIATPDNPTDQQVEVARLKAVDVKSKITDVSKFSDVAKEFSEDLGSRDKGGDLGTTPRGDVAKEFSQAFEDAIFSIPIGQVSDPVRSRHGWHLILVDKREGSVNQSLENYTADLHKKSVIRVFIGT